MKLKVDVFFHFLYFYPLSLHLGAGRFTSKLIVHKLIRSRLILELSVTQFAFLTTNKYILVRRENLEVQVHFKTFNTYD